VVLVAAAWGGGIAAACHAKQESPTRRYVLHGSIVAVNRGSGNIVVKHDAIPGYMSAMTMPFRAANPQDLTFLENGDEISAQVVVTIEGAARLEQIKRIRRARVTPRAP
jgi:protein SCO1/2